MTITKQELLDALGSADTNETVARLHRLAFIPPAQLETLEHDALTENWGKNLWVLKKYLAVHVAWSIEQDLFAVTGDQMVVAAGHLQTRYGTPLYLLFERNRNVGREPLFLIHCGSDISAPSLPAAPDIPRPRELPKGAEIVMLHDHILKDRADRVPYLGETPKVAQMCAVSGAIQWSINRGLQLPYWYYGKMNYLVPLYLQSREDITRAPDCIAPAEVSGENLMVRTVLPPHAPYANARASVKRHDQLPHWFLDAWNTHGQEVDASELEGAEEV